MALFPKSADTSRIGKFILNKRLIRIFISIWAFFLVVFFLLRRRQYRARDLPVLGYNETDEYYSYTTFSDYYPVSIDPAGKSTEDLCATFPKHLLDLVQPVLKMGHTEDRAKIEAQLDSVSACFRPNELLIFSDLDERIGNHTVIDILAHLPRKYYNRWYNPDIKHYLLQKELNKNGLLHKDEKAKKRIKGWVIDRFKFLPQIERAWHLRPDRPFYFFYETDTYVVWDNVFRFLSTFDPDTPAYMGSPSPGRHDNDRDIKTWFANGGPGYILSRGAMKALLYGDASSNNKTGQPTITEKWFSLLTDECCGDSVLGWALWNANVALQGYWPMFNPHPLHGIPFSQRYWCQPVLTLHKTSPKDMINAWRWEFGQRKSKRPMLYSDYWNFHHPGKPGVLDDWDNGDWDSWVPDPEEVIDSFETCQEACKKDDGCVQWNWRGRDEKKCILMRSIRYGTAREQEKKKGKWVDYKAGWLGDRIEKWRNETQCQVVEWVGPSIRRIF